jgi:hypothetical protein
MIMIRVGLCNIPHDCLKMAPPDEAECLGADCGVYPTSG